jgi:hypothetical protein
MHDTLQELERVLVEERSAIRKLDVNAIDAAATKKTELESKLHAAIERGEKPSLEDHALLERVRSCARANQLLLVHARACVRGVVSIVSGRLPDAYPASAGNAAPTTNLPTTSVRVNVTG